MPRRVRDITASIAETFAFLCLEIHGIIAAKINDDRPLGHIKGSNK
jgi:hypothetical protein